MTFRGKSDLYYQNWQLNKEKGIISQSSLTCKHTKSNSVVKLKINKRFFFLNSKTWEQWTLDFFFLWSNCKNRDSKYGVGKESRKATLARTPAPFDTQIRHTRDRVGKNNYLIPTTPENSTTYVWCKANCGEQTNCDLCIIKGDAKKDIWIRLVVWRNTLPDGRLSVQRMNQNHRSWINRKRDWKEKR